MRRLALIVPMFAAAAFAAEEPTMSQPTDRTGPGHSEPPPPPRDGQVAIQQEFEAARRAGTAAGWRRFITRHPDNPLTPAARAALAAAEANAR
ncbi:MAG: hypothetical protein K1X35_10160 [Caulobacteraceae bacterium]|nr:hypothetical protein [Caulobacteraceae bacterium]